jgi:hypothetical protein
VSAIGRSRSIWRARDELLRTVAMTRAVLVAVDDPRLASQKGPVGVERSQLSWSKVVDLLPLLDVHEVVGEDNVGVEPVFSRDDLEPRDEVCSHGPRHVVDGAARIDEIEEPPDHVPSAHAAHIAAPPIRREAMIRSRSGTSRDATSPAGSRRQ